MPVPRIQGGGAINVDTLFSVRIAATPIYAVMMEALCGALKIPFNIDKLYSDAIGFEQNRDQKLSAWRERFKNESGFGEVER